MYCEGAKKVPDRFVSSKEKRTFVPLLRPNWFYWIKIGREADVFEVE